MAEKESYRTKVTKGRIKTWSLEPLTIAALKGVTPSCHKTTFFDDRVEDIDFEIECDLVAITCETFTAKRAYEIAGKFRKRNITVIMGGFHPSLCPDEAAEYCDCVLVGEGEYLWPVILKDFMEKKLAKFYRQSARVKPEDIKTDKTIFKGKSYFPFSMVETGRGCCYNCEFCAVSEFFGYCYLRRPVENIIEEIRLSKKKKIMFVDDNIVADIPSAIELFKALIPLKIKWACQASIVIGQNPELLDLMNRSGCIGGLIGFESLDKANLQKMKKHQNPDINQLEEIVKRIYSFNLIIYASFVIGYDKDDAETVKETLKYAIDKGFFIANFYQLTPFPGTELYRRLLNEHRLIREKWWMDEQFKYGDLVFEPAKITPLELKILCDMAKAKFYSYRSILYRAYKNRVNRKSLSQLLLFLIVNLFSRTEMRRRRNRSLGRGIA